MDELISFIRREAKLDLPVGPGTPLISSGLIDSFTIARLITALAAHYRVELDSTAIGVDNFDTASQIYEFLRGSR
jgi:hypothetical protein